MKMTIQEWLEERDIQRRSYAVATWIPLMLNARTLEQGKPGHAGHKEESRSIESLIVPVHNRAAFKSATWHEIIRHNPHAAWADDDRFLGPQDYDGKPSATYPVLVQCFETGETTIWHLLQEIELSLNLLRKDDVWIRPAEDHIDVVRLSRDPNGFPNRIEIRSDHLRDYLAARKSALLIGGFVCRDAVEEEFQDLPWQHGTIERKFSGGEWDGSRQFIHEGGMPWGHSIAVLRTWRESVDPTDDVPVMPLLTEEPSYPSESYERRPTGRKLEYVQGRIWWTEWIEPAAKSPRIRRDEIDSTVPFKVGNQGEPSLSGAELEAYRGWLWFRPSVINELLKRERNEFKWHTRDTGTIGPSKVTSVHFGVNDKNLINVSAKDIARLPEWAQRVWVAHNVAPEGGLSNELHLSQNSADPASTLAPEMELLLAMRSLHQATELSFKASIFANLAPPDEIIRNIHRFHDTSFEHVCTLAKEMSKNILEKLNLDVITSNLTETNLQEANKKQLRSLKRLSLLLDQLGYNGRDLTRPLAGISDLRQGDAHTGSSSLCESLELFGISPDSEDYLGICLKMISDTAECLRQIAIAIPAGQSPAQSINNAPPP